MRLTVLNNKVISKTLAVPIYTQFGNIYMNKGMIFTERAIDKLNKAGINLVYIDDGLNEVILEEVLETRLKIKIIAELKEVFNECKSHEMINEKKIFSIVEELTANVSVSENAFLYNNLSDLDDITKLCLHSVDVATLAIIVGYNKKYNSQQLMKLGVGALLHDVGRIFNNEKEHTNIGYSLMKKNPAFSTTSFFIALSHHEYEDGSGYPNGLYGSRMHEFSKVVRLCNEYMNYYDKQLGMLPHEIFEKLGTMVPNKFDEVIYKDFISSIYCYPNGLTVKLNNDIDAVVISQNRNFPTRPLVAFKENEEVKLCNLMNSLTIFVKEIIF